MKKTLVVLILISLFCPYIVKASDNLITHAKSGILIEATTGNIIYEKNKDERLPVASMTKMIAQIIILENIEAGKIKWTDQVTVSKNASEMGGSQIYLSEGEKMSVKDLMKGISMASANDATVQMAEFISGNENKFVELMNKRVQKLALKNTNFKNCTGLDQDNHYSSSYDMAMIARELVNNHAEILKFSSVYEDYLRQNTPNKFWLVNTNKLVRFYEGADGLKTGHTDNAKYCLAATAKKNGMRLIAIVLGEEDSNVRNSEAMSLLDYGFSTKKMVLIKKAGEVLKRVKIDKANPQYIDVTVKNDLGVLEDKNTNEHKYNYNIVIDNIKLPLKKNSSIGTVDVLEDNKKVLSTTLVSKNDVLVLGYFRLLFEQIKNIASGE